MARNDAVACGSRISGFRSTLPGEVRNLLMLLPSLPDQVDLLIEVRVAGQCYAAVGHLEPPDCAAFKVDREDSAGSAALAADIDDRAPRREASGAPAGETWMEPDAVDCDLSQRSDEGSEDDHDYPNRGGHGCSDDGPLLVRRRSHRRANHDRQDEPDAPQSQDEADDLGGGRTIGDRIDSGMHAHSVFHWIDTSARVSSGEVLDGKRSW